MKSCGFTSRGRSKLELCASGDSKKHGFHYPEVGKVKVSCEMELKTHGLYIPIYIERERDREREREILSMPEDKTRQDPNRLPYTTLELGSTG